MFVGTGFRRGAIRRTTHGTVGGILAYNTEAKIWAQYIAEKSLEPRWPSSSQPRLRQGLPEAI